MSAPQPGSVAAPTPPGNPPPATEPPTKATWEDGPDAYRDAEDTRTWRVTVSDSVGVIGYVDVPLSGVEAAIAAFGWARPGWTVAAEPLDPA